MTSTSIVLTMDIARTFLTLATVMTFFTSTALTMNKRLNSVVMTTVTIVGYS